MLFSLTANPRWMPAASCFGPPLGLKLRLAAQKGLMMGVRNLQATSPRSEERPALVCRALRRPERQRGIAVSKIADSAISPHTSTIRNLPINSCSGFPTRPYIRQTP